MIILERLWIQNQKGGSMQKVWSVGRPKENMENRMREFEEKTGETE